MAPPKGRRSGRCSICSHEHRYRIEVLIVGGAGRRALGKRFGVSPDAVYRHGRDHVSDEHRAQLLGGPIKLRELADKATEEGLSLLEYVSMLRSTVLKHFFAAGEAGDLQNVGILSGRAAELLRLQAQLAGDLTRATATITNNTLIMASPIMADLQSMLVRTLQPFPEARAAVLAGLEELSRRVTPSAPMAALEALPSAREAIA